MKGSTIAAALSAALLGTALAAPMPAQPAGSKNLIAPPVAETSKTSRAAAKPLVVRHPTQAGKVSQTMSGNFVPSAAHSWIAKGDKDYSLCATTKDARVRCSPLVPAPLVADVEVAVSTGKSGRPMLTFTPDPKTKRTSKAVARSAGLFMSRVGRASAHLERQAVSYAPKPWEKSLQVGGGKSVVMAGGSSCGGYDDFGSYDCVGGEGGGGGSEGGGGEGGTPYDGGGYGGGGEGGGYPSNDPPPFDPTTGEGIDPNAPEVVIVGERPERLVAEPPADIDWNFKPPALPVPKIVPIPTNVEEAVFIPVGCIPGPRRTFVCPPALPANPGAIPPVTMPKPKSGFVWKWQWSDIEWCKVWNNCAPKANEGEQPEPPAVTPAEKFIKAMAVCRAEAKAHMEFCIRMKEGGFDTVEQSNQCGHNALENYKACERTATDLYNNGAGR
jgi:hypothetical protein